MTASYSAASRSKATSPRIGIDALGQHVRIFFAMASRPCFPRVWLSTATTTTVSDSLARGCSGPHSPGPVATQFFAKMNPRAEGAGGRNSTPARSWRARAGPQREVWQGETEGGSSWLLPGHWSLLPLANRDEQNRTDSGASRVKLGGLRSASDPTLSEQPELDGLRQAHVAEQGDHQNRPVQRR
jgi:hypothetical protein